MYKLEQHPLLKFWKVLIKRGDRYVWLHPPYKSETEAKQIIERLQKNA